MVVYLRYSTASSACKYALLKSSLLNIVQPFSLILRIAAISLILNSFTNTHS